MQEIRPHSRFRRADKKSQTKLILGVLFLISIMILFWYNLKDYKKEEAQKIYSNTDYIPAPKQGVIYSKPNFTLSYVEK